MFWKKKKNKEKLPAGPNHLPVRDISLDELRAAVHQYADSLPGGVNLSVVINEDLTINYDLLAPFLKAVPKQTYYMSRETYEIFEEKDKKLAEELDMVQKAVDKYMQQKNQLPVIDGDPYHRVSYLKLEKLDLLPYRPDRDFYVTDEEFLITHRKPQ